MAAMGIKIDISGSTIQKAEEFLCGCRFEIFRVDKSVIAILADGGPGAKGNVLSSLAVKMMTTLAPRGETAAAIADMIADAQPAGPEEGVGYAAFSLLQAFDTGQYSFEQFEMPDMIFLRRGKSSPAAVKTRIIRGKTIRSGGGKMTAADTAVLVNQGLINAGEYGPLKGKWNVDAVSAYAANVYCPGITANKFSQLLLTAGNSIAGRIPAADMGALVLRFGAG